MAWDGLDWTETDSDEADPTVDTTSQCYLSEKYTHLPTKNLFSPERSHIKSDKLFIRALKMSQEFNVDFSVAEVVESLNQESGGIC